MWIVYTFHRCFIDAKCQRRLPQPLSVIGLLIQLQKVRSHLELNLQFRLWLNRDVGRKSLNANMALHKFVHRMTNFVTSPSTDETKAKQSSSIKALRWCFVRLQFAGLQKNFSLNRDCSTVFCVCVCAWARLKLLFNKVLTSIRSSSTASRSTWDNLQVIYVHLSPLLGAFLRLSLNKLSRSIMNACLRHSLRLLLCSSRFNLFLFVRNSIESLKKSFNQEILMEWTSGTCCSNFWFICLDFFSEQHNLCFLSYNLCLKIGFLQNIFLFCLVFSSTKQGDDVDPTLWA